MTKKDVERDLGFVAPDEISEAKATHDALMQNPQARALSESMDQVMHEVENVFYQSQPNAKGNYEGAAFNENVIDWLIALGEQAGLSREQVSTRIRALKPGQYILDDLSGKRAYFKTSDGKLQEAAAYVNRLEKATISVMKELSAAKAALANAAEEPTAGQLFGRAFRKLFPRKK